ncbi:MAG: hypothetical protein H6724_15860 [Sandaracinus sp.]|nr:hypothetical protein [Sandaracinus sp.]MCB9621963.1 hypothetical protein [Sandaracinus sp.]
MSVRFLTRCVVLFSLVGCAQLREDLQRSEAAYDAARYEDAEVWLAALEPDVVDLDPQRRVRFYYLRGMTAERLGHRQDALHYLSLANELAGENGAGLRDEQRRTLQTTLESLVPEGRTYVAREPSDT